MGFEASNKHALQNAGTRASKRRSVGVLPPTVEVSSTHSVLCFPPPHRKNVQQRQRSQTMDASPALPRSLANTFVAKEEPAPVAVATASPAKQKTPSPPVDESRGDVRRSVMEVFAESIPADATAKQQGAVVPPLAISATTTTSPLSAKGRATPSSNKSVPRSPAVSGVENVFASLARHVQQRGVKTETLSWEEKSQLVEQFAQMQRCSGEEYVKLIERTKNTAWGASDHVGYVAGMLDRKMDWKDAFLEAGGINTVCGALQDLESRSSAGKAAPWYAVNDLVRCLEQAATYDRGAEGIIAHDKAISLLIEALEFQDDAGQRDTLALLSTISQRSADGLNAVIAAFSREKRQAMEKFLAMMRSESASPDLRVKCVLLLGHLLSARSPVWHPRLVVLLMRCNLSLELDALLEVAPHDDNLVMLISMLRERNPEFRRKDPRVLFESLQERVAGNKIMSASLANTLEHLSKLDQTEAVWRCVEGFVQTLAMTPTAGADAKSWFSGVVSRYASADARVEALNAKIAHLQAQLDGKAPLSRAVTTTTMHDDNEQWGNDDESSEFVDINGDGQRSNAAPKLSLYIIEEKM